GRAAPRGRGGDPGRRPDACQRGGGALRRAGARAAGAVRPAAALRGQRGRRPARREVLPHGDGGVRRDAGCLPLAAPDPAGPLGPPRPPAPPPGPRRVRRTPAACWACKPAAVLLWSAAGTAALQRKTTPFVRPRTARMPRYRLGVDIGGTFTDATLLDEVT